MRNRPLPHLLTSSRPIPLRRPSPPSSSGWRLAGVLTAAGIEAKVFDPNCCREPPQRALERELLAGNWDIVGVSTTGMTLRYDLELAYVARRMAPRAVLVAGGSAEPVRVLQDVARQQQAWRAVLALGVLLDVAYARAGHWDAWHSCLQAMVEELFGDRRGALVAIDPRNGEILAFVSKPNFDPNLFVDGIDVENWKALNESPDKPLLNRALRGAYPPGSTYKPFMAMAALTLGKRTPQQAISDPGYYNFGNHRFRDDKEAAQCTWQELRPAVRASDSVAALLA